MRRCPFRAAQWRGVNSSFKRQSKRESPRGAHQKLLERGQPVAPSQLQGHIEALRIGSREQSGLRRPLRAALEAGRPSPAGTESPPPRPGPAGSTAPSGRAVQLAGTHLGPRLYLGPTVQQQPHHDHVPPAGGDVQRRDAALGGGADGQDAHPPGGRGSCPAPRTRAPPPQDSSQPEPTAGLFSPKKDFQASEHRPASWFLTASWPGWASWGVNNTGCSLLETHLPGA